jgi:pyruvate dehydrogenase E1 component alpha subunit
MSDPQKYRSKEEVENYMEIDPISQVLKTIKHNKFATDKQLEAIDKKVKDLVAESIKFAEESPYPEADELYEDVYKEEYPFLIEYK